jgi:hypothetical protein
MDITIDNMRAMGMRPKWFGLGFIQMKANANTRFHFWHPDLPADDDHYADEWHDHRYDFTSTVMRGSLVTQIATVVPIAGGRTAQYHVCCQTGQLALDGTVDATPSTTFTTPAGNNYFLHRDVFHRVRPGGDGRVATLQERYNEVKATARVVRAMGRESANPFDSHIPEERLWEVIRDIWDEPLATVDNPGYHLSPIPCGVLGEASKVLEEALELVDAERQDARIMELVELSDLLGAVRAFMDRRHPGYSIDDLKVFSDITRRAFENGHR